MSTKNIFSTPIYEALANDSEINTINEEIENNFDYILKDEFKTPFGWEDNVQTNFGYRNNTIDDFKLRNLNSFINYHLQTYCEETKAIRNNIKLTQSWMNITATNQFQNRHTHQYSVVSGVYYYKTNSNDGELILYNSNPFLEANFFPAGTRYGSKHVIKPMIGKIVLFPGWMPHSVSHNLTNDLRISFSFNFE